MSHQPVGMQAPSFQLYASLFSSLVPVSYVKKSQVKLSNTRWFKYDRDKLWLIYTQIVPVIFEPPYISVSLRQGWAKPYLLSCMDIFHKKLNECILFRNRMGFVLWQEWQKWRFWLKCKFMTSLDTFSLLFLTESVIKNTQTYHKILLEEIKV